MTRKDANHRVHPTPTSWKKRPDRVHGFGTCAAAMSVHGARTSSSTSPTSEAMEDLLTVLNSDLPGHWQTSSSDTTHSEEDFSKASAKLQEREAAAPGQKLLVYKKDDTVLEMVPPEEHNETDPYAARTPGRNNIPDPPPPDAIQRVERPSLNYARRPLSSFPPEEPLPPAATRRSTRIRKFDHFSTGRCSV